MSKTINISQLKLNGTNKSQEKKPRKKSNSSQVKKNANDVRRKLLDKLKNRVGSNVKSNNDSDTKVNLSTFEETTKFLDGLVKNKNKHNEINNIKNQTSNHRQTQKNMSGWKQELAIRDAIIKPNSLPPQTSIKQHSGRTPSIRMKKRTTKVSNIPIKSDPPFGILKNGRKKTYRQYYNKPIQNNTTDNSIDSDIESPTIPRPPTPMKTDTIPQAFFPETRAEKLEQYKQSLPQSRRKYTIKRKFKLGYDRKKNEVSFLKKNKTMKVKYLETIDGMNTTTLGDKKIYLRKRGLLTAGSELPNELLCEMYRDAVLCGDVNNDIEKDLNIKIE
jgi:hypothetical protein